MEGKREPSKRHFLPHLHDISATSPPHLRLLPISHELTPLNTTYPKPPPTSPSKLSTPQHVTANPLCTYNIIKKPHNAHITQNDKLQLQPHNNHQLTEAGFRSPFSGFMDTCGQIMGISKRPGFKRQRTARKHQGGGGCGGRCFGKSFGRCPATHQAGCPTSHH